MKRLSVIIPVYNVEKYLRACLESLLAQSIPANELEVILVNDGSQDKSMETVSDLVHLFPDTIRIVNQGNSGVSVARNAGLSFATGNYILFLDSDDMLQQDSLSLLLKTAEEYDADMIRGKYVELYENHSNCLSIQKSQSDDYYVKELSGHDAYINLFHPRLGFCWQYLISRKLIVNNGLRFHENVYFMEDFAFMTLLFLKSGKFLDTSINFYIYRKNEGSCTTTISVQKLQSAIYALGQIYEQIPVVQGLVKTKMVSDLCYNVNIIVWYISHYKSIFFSRSGLVKSLLLYLRDLPIYAQGKDKFLLRFLYFIPNVYLSIRYVLSRF